MGVPDTGLPTKHLRSLEGLKNVLEKLWTLHGLHRIETDISSFLESGYLSGEQSRAIKDRVLEICKDIKDETVSLVDAM